MVLTESNWEENVVNAKHGVFVVFTTPMCTVCKSMKPMFNDVISSGHTLYEVNAFEQEDLAATNCVMRAPTVIYFLNGVEKGRAVGRFTEKELLDLAIEK